MTTKVLVVGSGVIGLRTALELLHRRIRVSLVSPQPPLHPSTCSMGAGGLWMPFHCDDSRTDRWSFETLAELTSLLGHSSLVEVLPAVSFKRDGNSQIPGWATDAKSKSLAFRHLSMDELYKESKSQSFRLPRKDAMEEVGYSHAWFFQTPIIDAPKMLTVSCYLAFIIGRFSFYQPIQYFDCLRSTCWKKSKPINTLTLWIWKQINTTQR